MVVSRTRWDKHQRRLNAPWRQNLSSSSSGRQWQAGLEEQRVAWSSSERNVTGAVEDYLERCADMRVDIEAEQEDEEVCPRYILKFSTRGGSNIFQLFDTREKKDHFVASRRRWLERQGEKVALQESWQNEWHDMKYHEIRAKSPSVPREDFENTVAAAKLVVIQGRRKPVGLWKTDEGGVSRSRRWPRVC